MHGARKHRHRILTHTHLSLSQVPKEKIITKEVLVEVEKQVCIEFETLLHEKTPITAKEAYDSKPDPLNIVRASHDSHVCPQ